MLKTLARFHLLGFRRPAPELRTFFPANYNVPAVLRPAQRQRTRLQGLACRWSLSRDGTQLACRWLPETLSPLEPDRPGLQLEEQMQCKRSPVAAGAGTEEKLDCLIQTGSFSINDLVTVPW